MDFENKLLEILDKSQILLNEPMKNHTSFKIGGNADFFVIVNNVEELKDVINICKENNKDFFVIGNGTNLLFTDKGYRGVIIKLKFLDCNIEKTDDGAFITVGAGYSFAKLSLDALKNSLEGLEFACGIPGTIGGAIRMNAGAYGGEIKDCVVSTKCMDYDGNIIELSNEEQEFSYRNSVFSKKKYIVLETKLKLKNGDSNLIKSKMDENNSNRKQKQPVESHSAGSTFKRKEGIITAKLIDECGLKGYCIGDAMVSDKHAGFLINKGNASFEEMNELIKLIQDKLLEKFNEKIDLEVLIVGEI